MTNFSKEKVEYGKLTIYVWENGSALIWGEKWDKNLNRYRTVQEDFSLVRGIGVYDYDIDNSCLLGSNLIEIKSQKQLIYFIKKYINSNFDKRMLLETY